MTISTLTSYIGNPNIAKEIDEDTLTVLGKRVKTQFQADLDSMSDWIENVEKGIELMRQEWAPRSTPWQGASNYKDPIMTEASVKFGDKASLELLRSPDLVAADVIGRDPEMRKKQICERVTEYMNYQINHEMADWRDDQEKLFYCLPNYGTVFKKMIHDDTDKTTESVTITFPNFAVNQATKTMAQARSFSHILDMSRNDIEERVRAGSWLDIDLYEEQEGRELDGDKGSNESNDVLSAADNEDAFIEQQCFFDLDEDGYEEPYIVTIHSKTCKVVRVVARFDEESIYVTYNDRAMTLPEAKGLYRQAQMMEYGGPEAIQLMGLDESVVEAPASMFKLRKIEPFQNVTKYGFIPAPDGTFLDFGYAHLLAAMTQAINTTTNQLSDAATLANVGGGMLSREFKKTPGIQRLKPGEYKKTDVPADKLAKGVFPNPAPEPSQTLYTLNQDMLARAQGFLAVVDVSGRIQANTAPTTALAIIQEAIIPTTALFRRILKAQGREFKILSRINQRTLEKDKYMEVLEEEADPQADFSSKTMDIFPTANAEMSSKMQRIQTAEIEMSQFDRVLQAGGNPVPILKNFFDAIGSELTDKVFPEEGSMSPAERKQMEQMQQAQETANQIQQLQLEILRREQDRLDLQTQAEIQKISAETDKVMQEIGEIRTNMAKNLAQAAKYGEEAETESGKNMVDIYTAQLEATTNRVQALSDMISALGAGNDRSAGIQAITTPRPGNAGALQ